MECHKKNSACSGNMSLFTICVCYKAYMLKWIYLIFFTGIWEFDLYLGNRRSLFKSHHQKKLNIFNEKKPRKQASRRSYSWEETWSTFRLCVDAGRPRGLPNLWTSWHFFAELTANTLPIILRTVI